jgi:dihydrofolate synthase / folylpolyglutamate synthase
MPTPAFSTYVQFLDHLNRKGLFSMKLGLGRMREALARLPRLQGAVVQVVGTNGKGSTSAYVEGLARAHGRRTGLFTSPHFLTPRERILVDGRMLAEEQWLELANELFSLVDGEGLTYFETVTLMAVLAFRDAEVAVFEAGLGGSLDATTAIFRYLVLFTPFGLDHEEILGPGLESIARDKSGVLDQGRGLRAVTAPQQEEVLAILMRRAGETGSVLELASEHFAFEGERVVMPTKGEFLDGVRLGMPGGFQKVNAATALAGWKVLSGQKGWPMAGGACKEGLVLTRVPGRLQLVPGTPGLILDGAHNAPALEALAEALWELGIRPRTAIFACLREKKIGPMAEALRTMGLKRIIVPGLPGNPRAVPAGELAAALGPEARPAVDAQAALAETRDETAPVLVCGSLYLLGEIFRLRPELLESREWQAGRSPACKIQHTP